MHARCSRTLLLLALVLTGAVAAERATSAQTSTATVIAGGTIIDGTGRQPVRDGVIVVEGGKISAIGPRSSVRVPAGARTIDATGKHVIPGLMDANVHLILGSSIEFIVRHEGRYEDLIEEAAQVALKNGLTTVFDSWGPLQPLLNVRNRINRGDTAGSRMFVAGNIVGFTGPFGHDFNGDADTTATPTLVRRINALWEENTGPDLMYLTPEQLRVEIRKYIARGIDFLKYGATGHREEYFLMFSPAAQQVIVEESRRAGITVQTHTTNVEGLRMAIEQGVDMLQHGDWTGLTPIPDSTIRSMIDRKVYCAIQPFTQKRIEFAVEQAEGGPPSSRRKEKVRTVHTNDVNLIKSGAPLLLATDAGMPDPDREATLSPRARVDRPTLMGEAHFLWFQAVAEKGMKPMDAIVAATRNVAAAYKKLDTFGTLEPGKLADLLLLDADPLADLANIRRISLVMKDGQVVDRERLPLKRVLTVPRGTRRTESAQFDAR
jgi:imidazolonepropionase-like amidohydrolase